jgi:LuxR family maltose regulon positive regulatory protein
MTRSDPVAPRGIGTEVRETLLAAKVGIPRPRADLLQRPRLLQALNEATQRELVLVCAAAGYGKTSLLAGWARTERRPVAWLSLDRTDNDPVRFWRYVVAAIERAQGHLETSSGAPPPSSPRREAVVADLSRRLDELPNDLVLVLDDYHAIEADPIHEALALLLALAPEGLHVVIGSRVDPPIPLATLRARGQLAELRAVDLRFTSQEAQAFFAEVFGLDLPEEATSAVESRTEGWAAGLQLAALSLRGRPDAAARVESFSGSHRFVLDYLTEEVLDDQTEDARSFLLETSVLGSLSGELCDAVTGRSDGQVMLEGLERANLFLVPLDEERRWYRFHHLFADLLRVRLQQAEPKLVPHLHRRAAIWCEERGLIDEAITHALEAGEPLRAARLVEHHVEELVLTQGERATMDRWIAALPLDVVRSRARLSVIQARSAIMAGRLAEVERFLDLAEAVSSGREDPYEPSVGRSASLIANAPAAIAFLRSELARLRGDPARLRTLAASVEAQLTPEDHMLRTLPRRQVALADWLEGRVQDAERGLAGSMAESEAAGDILLAAGTSFDLGHVQRARGRLRAAMRTHRRTLDIVAPPGRPRIPAAGGALVGIAEITYEWGRLDEALAQATEGVDLCRHLMIWLALPAGLAILASIRNALGDPTGAADALEQAERAIPHGVVSLLNPALSLRPRLLLAQGDVEAARAWVQERGVGEEDEPTHPREPEYLALARVLLAEQAPDRAARLLERIGSAAQAQGRRGSLIETRALQAMAFQLAGDEDGASAALVSALSLGRAEGYVRVFADEGPSMAALLRRLVATRRRGGPGEVVPIDYLGRILRSFEGVTPRTSLPGREGEVAGPAEALTARELEVLHLLAAGKRNAEIASELVVTLDTVKKHVSHIFDKLGATNRVQAVANANELGLIR